MRENHKKAKRFFLVNIFSNILAVLSNSLVGIWMTPFLIKHLGVAVFGMVPLVSSISSYLSIFNLTISGAVGRFVALNLEKKENEKSNIYFNSSVFGLIFVSIIAAIFATAVIPFLPHLIQIPAGFELDFSILVILIVITSFAGAVTSSFQVSTFITHKFYVYNIAKIASRLLQICLLVCLFRFASPSLALVGVAILGMTVFLLVSLIIASRKLTPQLIVNPRFFRWPALREMGGMGTWVAVDQVGTLLYLNSDLIIINLFLGPEDVGRYAPIIQLVMLMRVLAPAIAGVFAPVAIEYIARDEIQKLGNHTQKAIKFMGLLLALPAGLICGLAAPFLRLWLGPSFADQSYLVCILMLPQVAFLAINPLYNINRGLNKVRAPALATIAGGVLNIVLAIALIYGLQMGLLGMALASIISFALRSVVFLPIYTARCLGMQGGEFFKSMPSSLIAASSIFVFCLLLQRYYTIANLSEMIIMSIFVTIIYSIGVYSLLLKSDEKTIIFSLFGMKKKIAHLKT